MNKLRILLADDHQIFLDGLGLLLSHQEEIEIVATAQNGKEVLEILKSQPCDIALLDIHMPLLNGIEATKVIKKNYPHIKVLILTMDNELRLLQSVMEAGASGYLLKTTGGEELKNAILRAARGEDFFTDNLAKGYARQLNKKSILHANDTSEQALSKRELEILTLISQEFSNEQIAQKLFISPQTVYTHRKNLMKKTGAKNSPGLVWFALKNGLI